MLTSGFDDGRQWLTRGEAAQAEREAEAAPKGLLIRRLDLQDSGEFSVEVLDER